MDAIELPEGERQKAIVEADKKVIECYDKYPNESGYWAAKNGINSKMKLDQVLPIVSKSIFGKISASPTGNGKWVKNTAANRAKADPKNVQHLRPGEDPEIQKQAFKDAIGLVASIAKMNPQAIAKSVKDIGSHFTNIVKGKGSGAGKCDAYGKKEYKDEPETDGKKTWILD